jgi:hypothetical protein
MDRETSSPILCTGRRAGPGAHRLRLVATGLQWHTLEAADTRGFLAPCATLHLDRGYDFPVVHRLVADLGVNLLCAKVRKRIANKRQPKKPVSLGLRWPIERTNSWLSNFGQLRRNTDRRIGPRLAQLDLAVALLLTGKLIDWRNRWTAI